MKATRDWFGEALTAVSADHAEVVVVNCDLASATKTSGFKRAHPDRFFEAGIAEANAIGVAAGLAHEGFRPFVASFGHFLTGKFLEIFQTVGLNDSAVVMVGTHAGLAIGKDGPTQMGLRDVALMRTLPNVEILHPADGAETAQMMRYVLTHRRPTYLRLCRQPQREVHGEDYRFVFGVTDVLRRGRDVAIFSMGGTVGVVVDALPALAGHGIEPTVVNVSSLPLDPGTVDRVLAGHDHVFVIEDHFHKGGIADEIGRHVLGSGRPIAFRSWGVHDYGQAADPDDLYARYRLDADGVVRHLTDFLGVAAPRTATP